MNRTKWLELRDAMLALDALSPKFRSCHIENGFITTWDGEWYYHFVDDGPLDEMLWVELKIESKEQKAAVLAELTRIHLPGEAVEEGFRIYGYIQQGQVIEYF